MKSKKVDRFDVICGNKVAPSLVDVSLARAIQSLRAHFKYDWPCSDRLVITRHQEEEP